MNVDDDSALEMCGLISLHEIREHKSLKFAIKCTNNITNKHIFPINPSTDTHGQKQEKLKVNKTHTETSKWIYEMPYPPSAAFDPIFWLNHGYVDKQFSVWQELNKLRRNNKIEFKGNDLKMEPFDNKELNKVKMTMDNSRSQDSYARCRSRLEAGAFSAATIPSSKSAVRE